MNKHISFVDLVANTHDKSRYLASSIAAHIETRPGFDKENMAVSTPSRSKKGKRSIGTSKSRRQVEIKCNEIDT